MYIYHPSQLRLHFIRRGSVCVCVCWGGGGGGVLGKLAVPGRPANLENSRPRANCACSRCWWGLFGHFFSLVSLFFLPLWDTVRYRLKYCLKGPLNPKQSTNQPYISLLIGDSEKKICFSERFLIFKSLVLHHFATYMSPYMHRYC